MRRVLTGLGVVSLITVLGCVPSLQPLYTMKDIQFDEGLIGTWKQSQGGQSTWTFSQSTKGGQKRYDIVVTTKEENETKRTRMVGTLLSIKGTTYLDLYPAEPSESAKQELSMFWALHVVPAHSFWKVQRKGNRLSLHFMNPKWIKEYLQKHPDEIAHTQVDNRIVLTAPTAKLQQFVDKHKNTSKAFSEITLSKQ